MIRKILNLSVITLVILLASGNNGYSQVGGYYVYTSLFDGKKAMAVGDTFEICIRSTQPYLEKQNGNIVLLTFEKGTKGKVFLNRKLRLNFEGNLNERGWAKYQLNGMLKQGNYTLQITLEEPGILLKVEGAQRIEFCQ